MRYISKEGLEELKQELQILKQKRREIAERIEESKAMGDLSENTEYQDAREAQAFNEGRIQEIEQMLKEAIVISKTKKDVVQIGSMVKTKSESGSREFTIVGSEEADPEAGKVSNESPLGNAFLGRKVGDLVEVETPRGRVKYKILSIA